MSSTDCYQPDPKGGLAHLIGEAITDDVEAWEFLEAAEGAVRLLVTRDGVEFVVTVEEWQEAYELPEHPLCCECDECMGPGVQIEGAGVVHPDPVVLKDMQRGRKRSA